MVDQEGSDEIFELVRLFKVFEDTLDLFLHSLEVLLLAILKYLANGGIELQLQELNESIFIFVVGHQGLKNNILAVDVTFAMISKIHSFHCCRKLWSMILACS